MMTRYFTGTLTVREQYRHVPVSEPEALTLTHGQRSHLSPLLRATPANTGTMTESGSCRGQTVWRRVAVSLSLRWMDVSYSPTGLPVSLQEGRSLEKCLLHTCGEGCSQHAKGSWMKHRWFVQCIFLTNVCFNSFGFKFIYVLYQNVYNLKSQKPNVFNFKLFGNRLKLILSKSLN